MKLRVIEMTSFSPLYDLRFLMRSSFSLKSWSWSSNSSDSIVWKSEDPGIAKLLMSLIRAGSICLDWRTNCGGPGGKYVCGGLVLDGLQSKSKLMFNQFKLDRSNVTYMVEDSLDLDFLDNIQQEWFVPLVLWKILVL